MDLAGLIRTTKGDRSYDRLARDCGGRPTAARLQQIATSTRMTQFPDAGTIAALSRGLGVSVRTVVLAAAESLGLAVGESSPLADLLSPAAGRLTDRQMAAVLAVVDAMSQPYGEPRGSVRETAGRGLSSETRDEAPTPGRRRGPAG